MSVIAVLGDYATTTAASLAANWPAPCVLVEADPTGGDLAAWFDIPVEPSLSAAVSRLHSSSWSELVGFVRESPNGVQLLPCSASEVEARQTVHESGAAVIPVLSEPDSGHVIIDVGSQPDNHHPAIGAAQMLIVTHRQSTQSPAAAAVRLQRFHDKIAVLLASHRAVVPVVIGNRPFPIDEVDVLFARSHPDLPIGALPVDDLGAAVIGGFHGVSSRRMARLPLMRASRQLAASCYQRLDVPRPAEFVS